MKSSNECVWYCCSCVAAPPALGLQRRGEVTGVTLPGSLRTAYQYDQAGRMATTTLPDGSGRLTMQDTEGHTAWIARSHLTAEIISASLPDVQFNYELLVDRPEWWARPRDGLGVINIYCYNERRPTSNRTRCNINILIGRWSI